MNGFIKKGLDYLRKLYYFRKFGKFRPQIDGTSPINSIGVLFESKDEIDLSIIQDVATMPIDLEVRTLCFRSDKTLGDEYIGKVFDVAQALLKANEHRRKYFEQEKKTIKKFRKQSRKDPNKHINLTLHPVGLDSEIDGFLSQVKAALDSLACSLNPLFDCGLNAWRKDIKGDVIRKKSGYQIVGWFKSAAAPLSERSSNFRDYLEKNGDWLTYLSMLRDMPIHKGGLKNVNPLVFEQRTQKVVPQRIHHPNGQVESVDDFMKRTIKEVSEFCHNFLIGSLVLKTWIGLVPTKKSDGGHTRYYWSPPHFGF